MNWAITRRTGLDTLPLFLLTAAGSVAFVVLFSWAMVRMGKEVLEFVGKFPFIRRILEMSLGVRTEGDISLNILFAVSLTHLVVLALAWSLIIATVTRVTAGEIERGTADLLLSLPVPRLKIFSSVSLVWVVAAVLVALCPWLGIVIGSSVFDTSEEVRVWRFAPAVANLAAMHLFVGGMTTLLAVVFSRRSHAIAAAIGILLLSATLNFIEPFLEAVRRIRFVSLLNYFRPVDVVRLETWPVGNLCALLGAGLVCWILAAAIFVRRDIPVA